MLVICKKNLNKARALSIALQFATKTWKNSKLSMPILAIQKALVIKNRLIFQFLKIQTLKLNKYAKLLKIVISQMLKEKMFTIMKFGSKMTFFMIKIKKNQVQRLLLNSKSSIKQMKMPIDNLNISRTFQKLLILSIKYQIPLFVEQLEQDSMSKILLIFQNQGILIKRQMN
ncbi:hypothetical protein TTHERM_000163939 (macronuclear) [Tetrahymena thermophila SB210]|uniref:Uncharacterized protein n=1 Tax=Tetrahymena thermophila (strain SB210) TaxID=312017 RepID=W7XGL7_TETTS|nr:hypothetical protein TTHERM_000163939 [Tetrahymena thermophila SB210]EWS76178.1 hypothetical protein TTHERM_000163939 [Tetrahymena thermophila SB210]|eukprot:XP_012651225.1 hypothetical protein TTHERM_000163939 [Tetrahymena thermophila SB210]